MAIDTRIRGLCHREKTHCSYSL